MNGPKRDRDERIFEDLYPALLRFASVVADRDMAPEDLVHDAVVAALRLGGLSRLDDPLSYLRVAVLRQVSNVRRSHARRRLAFARWDGSVTVGARDEYPSDLAYLFEIGPTARAILYLHEVEGWPYADIGRLLGMREASVRKAAERARRQLRQVLEAMP